MHWLAPSQNIVTVRVGVECIGKTRGGIHIYYYQLIMFHFYFLSWTLKQQTERLLVTNWMSQIAAKKIQILISLTEYYNIILVL